jgi:hypothetical protein
MKAAATMTGGPGSEIERLMNHLLKLNDDEDPDRLFPQKRLPAEPLDQGIPLLAKNRYRQPSPMLAIRFALVGRWENAATGQTWLGINDMKKAWSSKAIAEQIGLRRKYWPTSVVAQHPDSRITLYALWEDEKDETYLLWPEDDSGTEPEIYRYVGYEENRHENLLEMLKWLTER